MDSRPAGDDKRSENFNAKAARLSAMLALAWERFWPLIVPSFCVILLFLIFSWLGFWRLLPDLGRYGGMAVFAGLLVYALSWLRQFSWPSSSEVTRRIELASGLQHRPLTARQDRLSLGGQDALARALWEEHRRRMAAGLDNLTGGAPAPDANRVDPWAVRAAIAAIAFAAFGYSLGPRGGSIAEAVTPSTVTSEVATRLDAWINPPAYTRRPPVFLSGNQAASATGAIPVPQGSELYIRFVGEEAIAAEYRSMAGTFALQPVVDEDPKVQQASLDTGRPGESEFRQKLDQSGSIVVSSNGKTVREWQVEIIPDTAPSIRFAEIPSAALSGSLQLAYTVEDDYGVTGANADIRTALPQAADARPLVAAPELPLPLPRQRARTGTSKVNRDLSQHPWAGSRVSIRLKAVDDAGQTGQSEPHEMTMPGRRFSNPVALAILEQRRILALDANQSRRVADLLDATMTAPEELIGSPAAYIAMTVAWRRIVSARDDDTLRSALDLMWEIALALEFGNLSEAERKLREAQEKLSEALQNGASDEEIERLMEELRQAMNEFLQQLVEEAMRNPQNNSPFEDNPMTQSLRQRDLDRMLDQIENLARSGSRDAAREMLSELQRMMDNLRAGRNQQQQQQAEGSQMNQALDQLSELMRRQQELMDQSFRMQQQRQQNGQQQPDQPGQQGQQGQQGEQGQMTPEEFAEALKRLQEQQQQLQQDLEQLGQQLEGLGLDPSEQFGEAGREMGEAGENLGQGNPGGAAGDQGQALEALRQGAQSMMQQMAGRQPGQGEGQGEGRGGRDRERFDPLGRSQRADGLEDNDQTRVPGEIDAQRAREIMEAIRERLARPEGPVIEKRYLERLLETE